jgi:hypothetical protein
MLSKSWRAGWKMSVNGPVLVLAIGAHSSMTWQSALRACGTEGQQVTDVAEICCRGTVEPYAGRPQDRRARFATFGQQPTAVPIAEDRALLERRGSTPHGPPAEPLASALVLNRYDRRRSYLPGVEIILELLFERIGLTLRRLGVLGFSRFTSSCPRWEHSEASLAGRLTQPGSQFRRAGPKDA